MKFNVTDIEFDFDDDYCEDSKLTFEEEIEIRDLALGVWEADDEDDMMIGKAVAPPSNPLNSPQNLIPTPWP